MCWKVLLGRFSSKDKQKGPWVQETKLQWLPKARGQ